jgi:TBC1 domain family protein 5
MPENLYFRQPDTQRMLLDILFIFCKLNPDLSYRQGMHEILAPILWVVERDAIDLGESSKTLGEDAVVKTIFDADYIEHDAFALFGQVMQSAKNFYEQTTTSGRENPMVARSRRIFDEMLPLVDSKLAAHLTNVDVIPQIFLMRWIRLLFGREFEFDELLTVWDVIFAEDSTLEIVDHICLAMLLRIHWDLINADYNTALTLLLKYPDPGTSLPAQTFVLDALYLREHMDQHCGSHLVSKYTGKPLQHEGRPLTPPALQRNVTTVSGADFVQSTSRNGLLAPARPSTQPRNLEAVLQSTAKNIYARSERLGIGKAVRSAVDEVHKKAQEIRDHQTPSPPVVRRPRGSRSAFSPDASQRRIKMLQDRSKQLSKLLDGAVSELWDFQKIVAENVEHSLGAADPVNVEKLSVAIAKVQFVQVYLDDSDLPMPDSESKDGDSAAPLQSVLPKIEGVIQEQPFESPLQDSTPLTETAKPKAAANISFDQSSWNDTSQQTADELADPSTFEDFEQPSSEPNEGRPDHVAQANTASTTLNPTPGKSKMSEPSLSRPRLEQSSLSWMLGQDGGSDGSVSKSLSLSQDHGRNRAFLFGDNTAAAGSGSKERSLSRSSGKKASIPEPKDGEEIFDLGSLRHGKGKNV